MNLPAWVHFCLLDKALAIMAARPRDMAIGGEGDAYMSRWYLTPWSRYDRAGPAPTGWRALRRRLLPNVYLHRFHHSDDDRALHDHPWISASIILAGAYLEHSIAAGGVCSTVRRTAGDVCGRRARAAHRIELADRETITLFITGPVIRNWGFHCPRGWRPWREFTAPGRPGEVGRGCE